MKKITLLSTLCFLLLTLVVNAQTPPNAFNYSAVARNAAGQPIATTTIGIQITILKTSPTGVSQYSENHFVYTDAFGLFNIVIGAGALQSGSMTTIVWNNDNYFLKIGMDATGGTNFLTMGTTQLLSVPYALHAKTAESISGGIFNPIGFMAINQTSQSLTSGSTLVFNSVSFNDGSGYNPATGVFTAPQNGVYMLSVDLILSGNGTSTFEIWLNNNSYYVIDQNYLYSKSFPIKLSIGETVQIKGTGSSNVFLPNTFFSIVKTY